MGAPYYFAWADSSETTFGPEHHRYDLTIFSAVRRLVEADKPTLTLLIKNPEQPLLASGRQIWAWFAHTNRETGHVEPLFFGRLFSLPTNIIATTCTIKFIAEPLDYLEQQQRQAELLKVSPMWEPLFTDPAHRDDPNAILEGYTYLWHVDPVTLEVTPSDLLVGDSIEDFQQSDAFYKSVSLVVSQAPLLAVNVDATVEWTQSDVGIVPIGQRRIQSKTGGSIVSEWPKPEASVGGGWQVHSSRAVDLNQVDLQWNGTFHQSWENRQKEHLPGDSIAWDYTMAAPEGLVGKGILALEVSQPAFMDPFNPDFADITTAWDRKQFIYVGDYDVATNLTMRYDAERHRTERVRFTLPANIQEVMTQAQSPPLPSQETITISGQNVGERLVDVLDWLSVKNTVVAEGQVIYPNQPTIPGGSSYQICTTGGMTGNVEPTFSPDIGQQTVDNTAVWTSLGPTLSSATPDWTGSSTVTVGTVIRPLEPLWATWTDLNPPPNLAGANISIGEFVMGGGALQVATIGGTTGISQPGFSSGWGSTVIDGSVHWTSTGPVIPDGETYYVAIQAGTTSEIVPPPWNPTLGATFSDGSVIWKSLGDAGRFVDLPIGDLSRSNFFPQLRGNTAIEHLICRARAKLIARARCAEVKWDCRYDRAVNLTCRMNARLTDFRLPGGIALGKITETTLTVSGPDAQEIASVKMMCAIGRGNHVTSDPGVPTYVEEGYVEPGYQVYAGGTNVVSNGASDVGYTPPAATRVDDGLIFPLTRDQVVIRDAVVGTVEDQQAGVDAVVAQKAKEIVLAYWASVTQGNVSLYYQAAQATLSRIPTDTYMRGHEMYYELDLKPVNGGPFNADYPLITTMLEIPRQIDTE